mgnify:CR=1 FL=1
MPVPLVNTPLEQDSKDRLPELGEEAKEKLASLTTLVALYFSCCSNFEKDGVVYEIHAFPLYNQNFVWISIVSKYLFDFSPLPFDCSSMIEELKQEQTAYPPRGVESFYTDDAIEKILTMPLGLYPRFTNNRIRNQDGVFVIAGMNIKEKTNDGIIFEK